MKKVLPPTYLYIYLFLAVALYFVLPVRIIISSPYNNFGVLFLIIGLVLTVWSNSFYSKYQTTVKPFKKSSSMITKGPYTISRNPMYMGMVITLLGVAIILGNLTSFISPVLMFITLESLFIPQEEKDMEAVFGKKFQEYKKKVRKWL